ncbi:hypothetical protein PQX77_011144 [Marasmius sp. AFHP31]|nr:hypothetical protein PQX77_011144 [Marasmius sp. AFHP31]
MECMQRSASPFGRPGQWSKPAGSSTQYSSSLEAQNDHGGATRTASDERSKDESNFRALYFSMIEEEHKYFDFTDSKTYLGSKFDEIRNLRGME